MKWLPCIVREYVIVLGAIKKIKSDSYKNIKNNYKNWWGGWEFVNKFPRYSILDWQNIKGLNRNQYLQRYLKFAINTVLLVLFVCIERFIYGSRIWTRIYHKYELLVSDIQLDQLNFINEVKIREVLHYCKCTFTKDAIT